METKNVSLTELEANQLIQYLDVAVKTLGLNHAEAALVISKKIREVYPLPVKEEEVKPEVVKKKK